MSLISSQSPVSKFTTVLQMLGSRHAWQVAFGAFGVVDSSAHLLMLGFSTHMRPLIVPPHLPLHMLAKKGKRSYEQRIREIEDASFVPAVFAATRGMGQHATSLYKRIASLLSEKTAEPYNTVMARLRCRMSFALLRSSIMCVRGSRSLRVVSCPRPQYARTLEQLDIRDVTRPYS